MVSPVVAYPVRCPTCNSITTEGAIKGAGTYPERRYRCPTCWEAVNPVAYDELLAKHQKWIEAQKKKNPEFNVKVHISYDNSKGCAKKLKYKFVDHQTQKVLMEGITDEKGYTEKFTADKPVDIEVIAIRRNNNKEWEEKNIGRVFTSKTEDYVDRISLRKGRIFFDIRYVNSVKDKTQSFIKAAETLKRRNISYNMNRYQGDVWWSFDVTTECDIQSKWEELAKLQEESDLEIQEGHLLTHATKGDKPGLTFAEIGCNQDGTLTIDEIKKLPLLKWSIHSELYLYGCRTGLKLSNENNKTMADAFFEAQNIKTVIAQKGYGYFSYRPKYYVAIDDDINDTKDIYLWAFNRGLNVTKINAAAVKYISAGLEQGDGLAIAPYRRSRY
jgi:hypothetical protein